MARRPPVWVQHRARGRARNRADLASFHPFCGKCSVESELHYPLVGARKGGVCRNCDEKYAEGDRIGLLLRIYDKLGEMLVEGSFETRLPC